MSRYTWTDAIQLGFIDTLLDSSSFTEEEERDQRMRAFATRWEALDLDAFKRVLQEGDEPDRLWALFTLGRYAPAGVADLLVPFLSSPLRKERWASAIGLGTIKDERAFSVLQDLLLDQIKYDPPDAGNYLEDIWSAARYKAQKLFGDSDIWEYLVSPTIVTAWHEQNKYNDAYQWYMYKRRGIIEIFRLWDDPRVVPSLRQTFQKCWEMEQLPPHLRGLGLHSLEIWYEMEDALAYLLGQLCAWNALDHVEMSPARFKLARMYLVLGSLQVKLIPFKRGNIQFLLDMADVDRAEVIEILQKQYGLDHYLAEANFEVFGQWYNQREATWNYLIKIW